MTREPQPPQRRRADSSKLRRPSATPAAGAMLQLRRRLLPMLRAASHPTTTAAPSSSLHLRAPLLSTSASAYASSTPFSIEDYLLTTCGLTRAQALNASKKLSRLNSASNPDAVLALLSGVGLSRPDIAAVVAADPPLLRARVDNIARRLASLRDRVGLSHPQIARFLLVGGARTLRSCDVAPRLEFWIPFFGSFDKLLKKVKWNNSVLTTDLERVVKPNIALLKKSGLGVRDIVKLTARLLVLKPERVKVLVKRVEKLGVPRTSYAFKYAVSMAACVNEEKVAARMEFLMSTLACSKDKLRAAVCRLPQILGLSEEKLRCKIEFMVTEVRLVPEYIVERPLLLACSLEKRLVPRHYVIKTLQAKGLVKKGADFCSIVCYADKAFIAKYIDCHKDAVPELADAYAAVRAGKVPTKVQL